MNTHRDCERVRCASPECCYMIDLDCDDYTRTPDGVFHAACAPPDNSEEEEGEHGNHRTRKE